MIGIIGFGRFGKLAAAIWQKILKSSFNTRADKASEISLAGGQAASLEEVCQQDIIIPCVPISVFKDFLNDIAPLIKPDALDNRCLFGQRISGQVDEGDFARLRFRFWPPTPMFGPDSASDSLQG